MPAILPNAATVHYPSSDGEPVAETYLHLYALLTTLEVLRQYIQRVTFSDPQGTVLGNQFLYYSQGYPNLRVAPDTMVIFNVEPGGRDNYKIWEEGQVPSVIFEFTSKGTRSQDEGFKKTLYEQLGVEEYWLFDPKGEWITEQLVGYRLQRGEYVPITDGRSEPLRLKLMVEGALIGFYREDNGEKLLIPDELAAELQRAEQNAEQERQRAELAEQRAEVAEQKLAELQQRLQALEDG